MHDYLTLLGDLPPRSHLALVAWIGGGAGGDSWHEGKG
jgi:hypothetical protein